MVTRRAITSGAPATAAAFSPTLPTHAATDRLILAVLGKYNTTTVPTINQGWTLIGSGTGGTGSAANDSGQTFWAIYAKDAASASETAPTVTPGGTAPNSWVWFCESWQLGASKFWRDSITTSASWLGSISDTTTASPLTGSATISSNQPTAGDAISTFGVIPTDLGTAIGSATITATGLSGGTVATTSGYVENALGQDCSGTSAIWTGFTGTASASISASHTTTGASDNSGSIVVLSLRETSTPPATTTSPTGIVTGEAFGTAVKTPVEISFVGSTTADYTATTPAAQTVNLPSGWQAGDLILLFIPQGVASNSTTVTWSGSTQVANPLGGSDQFTSLWYKIATGSETITFSTSDASSRSSAIVAVYRGVDPSTPLDTTYGFADSPAGTSHTVPSQTVNPGSWLVSLASLDGSAGTATPQYTEPSGWTKRLDYNNNTTDNYASALADKGPVSGSQSGFSWTSVYADRAVNVTVVSLRLNAPLSLSPTAIASGEVHGSPTVSISGGATSLSPTAIASTESFGAPVASLSGVSSPTGISSAEAFGSPTALPNIPLSPGAIATGEAFGTTVVDFPAAGAAQFIGATSVAQAGTAGTSSPSVAIPSGTQGGDVMIAFHSIGSSSDTITFPGGWSTPVRETGGTGIGDSISWKIASGTVGQATTESAFTVSSGSARNHGIILLVYRLSDNTTPLQLTAHQAQVTQGTSKTTPGGTVSGSILELTFAAEHPTGSTTTASNWTDPSGITRRGAANNVQNGNLGTSIVAGEATAGTTNTGSIASRVYTTALSNMAGSGWSVALKSGTGSNPVTPTIAYRVNGLARIRTKTNDATSVRLKIGTNSAVTTGVQYTSAQTPNGEGLSLHDWTGLGLMAGQRYYYRVMMTDTGSTEITDTESTVGTFKVAPTGQASFNFCFGGCTQEGPDSAALAAVAARGDDFFLHLGDMYYADGSGTGIANFRAKMDEKLSVANHKAVFATMGMSYCGSDHDGGMNNNYVGAGDTTARDNFNAAHRERFPNPLVPSTTGTYHAWSWGRVRFVHTDERSFKSLNADTDNSSKTILGATQKQWLKDEITNATEKVIIWIGDTPWTGATSAGQDHWAGYNTERTEMANFITASGKNVARLGSDMHAVAADDGTNSAAGIPVFHGGPLNNNASIKGNPYSHGPYPASGTAIVEQYGRIVVTDSGSQISLAFTGYSADNTSRVTYTKTYNLVLDLTPTAIPSNETFGSTVASPVLNTAPSGIASAETVGSPTITSSLLVTPTAISSGEAFGTTVVGGVLSTAPSGIASAAAFGSASIQSVLSLIPTGITTGVALGTPSAGLTLTAQPSGIITAEALGNPSAAFQLLVSPSGIITAESLGIPSAASGLTVNPNALVSLESFGTPVATIQIPLSPSGIASALAFGTTAIANVLNTSVTGIASGEAFGNSSASLAVLLTPSGIATALAFGTPNAGLSLVLTPNGIATLVAFGSPSVSGISILTPDGIATAEAFGLPSTGAVEFVGWGIPIGLV